MVCQVNYKVGVYNKFMGKILLGTDPIFPEIFPSITENIKM